MRLAPNKSISGQLILSRKNIEWGAVETFVHQRGVALLLSTAPSSIVNVSFRKNLVFAIAFQYFRHFLFSFFKAFHC